MVKKILISSVGIIFGIGIGFFIANYTPFLSKGKNVLGENTAKVKKEVIGFLPYWLLESENSDYSKYITTLAYFGLRVGSDGHVVKLTTPTQSEPGWYALKSGKVDSFLESAKKNNVTLSLVVDSGSVSDIDSMVRSPVLSADNLAEDLLPIMEQYGFTDVNLDIEYVNRATNMQRKNFSIFVSEVKKKMPDKTLTVEISNGDAIKPSLIDVSDMAKVADYVVIMAYDFHFSGSFVSGPVAPVSGAGTTSEYDVTAAVENGLKAVPPEKLILGVPLYGYEWETLGDTPRLSIIPGSGVTASNSRAETLLSTCSDCKVNEDKDAEEKYITYFDSATGANHIIFYPDRESTSAKIDLANELNLGGIALWALGYEGKTILSPLSSYVGN